MKARLIQLWETSKWAAWMLLALLAVLLLVAMRARSQFLVNAAERRTRVELDQLATPEQKRKYMLDQRSSINRMRQHVDAANEAKKNIGEIADALQADGHPSVAELVRSWNRE